MTPVVVLDACVLYPAAQRDLFMWLAPGGAIRAHWVNGNWRVTFEFENGNAFILDYEDYH